MNWRWPAALLPALLGLILATVIAQGWLFPPPDLAIRIGLGNVVLLSGICFSSILVLWIVWLGWVARIRQETQTIAANDRRRFLRRLDHELKNPLTAIRAGLANLAETPSEEARQEVLESVDAQALRLSRLAADLRKLAELETRPLERSPVDLPVMLQEAFELAQDRPEAHQRRLSLSLPQAPWPLPTISGDADLLFLAAHNLIDNAIKYTREGNTVEVRAFEDGASVVIEVADTGPGIPDEELPHVWEELYRGKGARGIQGSGLGLALVRAIVERHGGQVTCRSRQGQGTVFAMRLPVSEVTKW